MKKQSDKLVFGIVQIHFKYIQLTWLLKIKTTQEVKAKGDLELGQSGDTILNVEAMLNIIFNFDCIPCGALKFVNTLITE